MTRHETERLWALAADELELDDKRYVELHLSDCPECRDSLEAVQLAQRALDSARTSSPALDWLATDERVGAIVEKRMRKNARPKWMPFAMTSALVAVAAAVTAAARRRVRRAWAGRASQPSRRAPGRRGFRAPAAR